MLQSNRQHSTLNGFALKLVDKFIYLGISVSSTEKDIDTRLEKTWTAIDSLSVVWKSDLSNKMKRSFFQTAVVSIMLYGCTMWTLTKRIEKKLEGNYTGTLWAILNMSQRQHPTKQQLYCHLQPVTKTIKIRRTRHAGHCWRSRDELVSDVLQWTPSQRWAKKDVQLKYTYSGSVQILGVVRKIWQNQWTIGRGGERWSELSVLIARHDHDDDSTHHQLWVKSRAD